MVDPAGRPIVVAIVPGQPELVALTAQAWGRAVGASELYFAYADTSRVMVAEHADGSVDHQPVDPDGADDEWREVATQIEHVLTELVRDVPWQFRFLAGRPDRALTHLARAVDASAFVVGTRAPGAGARLRSWVEGSVAVRLTHHQHRPVLVVPLQVVDWKARSPWA
ncbi:MAG: universal stress protein [Actinobacteria bacterium]|nr:universal stress protein [Actinomycetota bacterium]